MRYWGLQEIVTYANVVTSTQITFTFQIPAVTVLTIRHASITSSVQYTSATLGALAGSSCEAVAFLMANAGATIPVVTKMINEVDGLGVSSLNGCFIPFSTKQAFNDTTDEGIIFNQSQTIYCTISPLHDGALISNVPAANITGVTFVVNVFIGYTTESGRPGPYSAPSRIK